MYVMLTATRVLEFYADEADVGVSAPKASAALSSGAPARLLDDPPYNYEHAICVGATVPGMGEALGSWWLCPDTPAESKAWISMLNAPSS